MLNSIEYKSRCILSGVNTEKVLYFLYIKSLSDYPSLKWRTMTQLKYTNSRLEVADTFLSCARL